MTREEKKLKKLQDQCDKFNAANPVGTKVLVRRDSGNVITYTRSQAQVLSGHTPVIFLEGISGCYLLDRVEPIIAQFHRESDRLVPVEPQDRLTTTEEIG